MTVARKALYVLAVACCVELALSVVTLRRVRQFRRFPVGNTVSSVFDSEWPHNIIGRPFLFKRGAPIYHTAVRDYLYRARVADNPWNRWFLEQDALGMITEEAGLHLPAYPIRPTERLLPVIKRALDSGYVRVLPVLNRIDSSEAATTYGAFVGAMMRKDIGGQLADFVEMVVRSPTQRPSPGEVLSSLWPRLSQPDRQQAAQAISTGLRHDARAGPELFDFVTRRLDNFSEPTYGTMSMWGRFLSLDGGAERVVRVFLDTCRNWESRQGYVLGGMIEAHARERVSSIAMDIIREEQAPMLIEMLHALLDGDLPAGERLLGRVIEGRDSTLRKGAIVVLARHRSPLGVRRLNEAFMGTAPRRTYFIRTDEYVLESPALRAYETLAKHPYTGAKKTWPPLNIESGDLTLTNAEWRRFIALYPWFPGTDDAYYRLMAGQMLLNDHEAVVATARAFWSRELPDVDAAPYVKYVLRALAMRGDTSEDPLLGQLRVMLEQPLGLAVYQGGCQRWGEAVLWFARANMKRVLSESPEEAHMMETLATACVSGESEDERLRHVSRILGEQTLDAVDLLYNDLFSPESQVSDPLLDRAVLRKPLELAQDLSQTWALELLASIGPMTPSEETRFEWLLTLFKSCYFCRGMDGFRPTFDRLSQIDTARTPDWLRPSHADLRHQWAARVGRTP